MTGMKPPVVDKLLGPDLGLLKVNGHRYSQVYDDFSVVRLISIVRIK